MISRIKQLRERLGEIVRVPSVILLSTASLSYSQLEKEIPMMEFLPNGTALTNVSIPSYDDNLKPTSLFKADEVKMIDKKNGIMEATNVRVKIFTEENELFNLTILKTHYFVGLYSISRFFQGSFMVQRIFVIEISRHDFVGEIRLKESEI